MVSPSMTRNVRRLVLAGALTAVAVPALAGTAGAAAPTAAAAASKPVVSDVHVRPTSFKAGTRAFIRFRLSGLTRRATVSIRIQRPVHGHRWTTMRTISRSGGAGANAISFNGDIAGHNLPSGNYRVSVTWSSSAPAVAPFRIL